ncbi:TetR/AcrR family transcriptional regulator [Marinicella sp. W31]|uniref:TetR/AcrR family transcriptional regulator n=1 Tax=Marinicella sp. W31 TaxID=3023713 RepID=UPI0037563BD8
MNSTVSVKKKSLNPSDWELATLNVIAHQGVNAVAIEPLARELGVTKGSFYWHFSNRMDLIDSALKRWRNDDRAVIEEKVLVMDDPKKRLQAWFMLSAEPSQSHLIYATLLADRQHKLVAKVLKEITIERLNYLQQSYREIGYSDAQAKQQALLAYSVYVGYLHMAKTLHGNLKDTQTVEDYALYVADQLIA